MRVLLVSYHLYPDGTAEGICVAKTARALQDAGHEVTVITSDRNGSTGEGDAGEALFVSGMDVHMVAADHSLAPGWASPFYRVGRAAVSGSWLGSQLQGRATAVPNLILGCGKEEYAWVAAAARQIAHLWNHADAAFDVIYSRLNHSTSHLAVLAALPRLSPCAAWCAHFSDPWPHHLYPVPYRSKVGPLARLRLEGLLGRILTHAGSITFPGERLMRFVLSGRREIHRGKAHVVPHLGNAWLAPRESPDPGKLSILFAGFLLKQRNPSAFLRGLRLLFNRCPEASRAIVVRFVGNSRATLSDLIQEHGLQDVVFAMPHLSFEETWSWMCRSNVLLLIESPMEEGIFTPSKLADYLSARRPILALSPAVGAVADMLSEGGGVRVDPDNPEQIAAALAELYTRWQAGRLEELRPGASLVDRVSPASAIPGYEAAFRQAMAARRGLQ